MGGEVDGDVCHEDGERRAAGLDYREGSPAASRSEEEDRELVLRRRGPTALDLRLLRRRQVAFVDPSLEVETLMVGLRPKIVKPPQEQTRRRSNQVVYHLLSER